MIPASFSSSSLKRAFIIILFSIFSGLLLLAIWPKLHHTYLEDDLLWCLPAVENTVKNKTIQESFKIFAWTEMTPFNGFYYCLMIHFFGFNLKAYSLFSFLIFTLSGFLFFLLLNRRMKLNLWTSLAATLMYITFFGHFHIYIWSFTSHHLFVIFFIFLISNLYMKTEELMEQQKGWKGYYILTLLMMFLAAFMRLSIVIIPALILGHILLIRKEEHILKKLTLWLPGIFLIVAGQLYFTLMIKLQFTLHKLTTPVKHLFHNYSPGWAFLFSLVFISIIWLSTYIAIKIKIYRFIKKGFEFLVLGWFLAPQYIGLCLYLWLRPVIPDSEINPFMRLQLMSFPSGLPGLILLCAVTSALMLIFSIYARKHNKPLMLFILWSMILFFFFDFSPKDTPSRYLIYAMPTTACLISCLLFEILPQWIPSLKLRFYRAILFTCIMIIAVFNILGIHQRLAQTILSNIIWSYDYAKTANLIADDLKKNGGEGLTDVCVRNVQPIPYLKNFGFLDNYDFHSEDAFAITMRSRWPQANVRWYINQPCPANALIYQNTDTTVVDQSGRNLEKENPLPFAFQLFLDMDHRFWLTRAQKLARAQAMIKASIQPFPGEDAKMLWIKRMLEQELRVYEKTKNRDH